MDFATLINQAFVAGRIGNKDALTSANSAALAQDVIADMAATTIAKIDALAPSDRFTAQGKALIGEAVRIKGWVMSLAPADCQPIIDAMGRYMERCKAA